VNGSERTCGIKLLRFLHAGRPIPPSKHTVQRQLTITDARTKLTRRYPSL
jgi:hypothetical protein